jgi:SAM-dependent methyltransferase
MTTNGPFCPEPLVPILALGELPLANALLTKEQLTKPEPRYPLTLGFCPSLALVQIAERIPPAQLFSNYPYFSSMADEMLAHVKRHVEQLTAARALDADSLVVEIASNDGYLLQYYKAAGIPVLGVEPAANIAKVASAERGIPTLVAFFDEALGHKLAGEGRRAAVVHANNVFAHVPDPVGFLKGIAALLEPGGIASIEAPYVKDMIDKVEFDTIYHEHLFYYSLTAVTRLTALAGLAVVDVERLPIHGGSLRYILSRPSENPRVERVDALLAEERGWNVESASAYRAFASTVETLRAELRRYLENAKRRDQRIAAYGASAKGTTLLNFCGVGSEFLDFVVDRSPYKQGLFTPGTHLPILDPGALVERQPDAVLLLAWNFADEILAAQAEYRRRGGKFIIPVPQLRIV